MKKLLSTSAAVLLTGAMTFAPMTATADPWANQAGSDLSFLPQGQVSAGVAGEVQGEGWGSFAVPALNFVGWCISNCGNVATLVDTYGSAYGIARAAYRDWRRNGQSPDIEGYMYQWLWREGVRVPRY